MSSLFGTLGWALVFTTTTLISPPILVLSVTPHHGDQPEPYPRPQSCCISFPPTTPPQRRSFSGKDGYHHANSDQPALPPSPHRVPMDASLANPLFDRLLFISPALCPVEKSDQVVCDAVSLLYGKPHTAMYAKPISPYAVEFNEDETPGGIFGTNNAEYNNDPVFVKKEWLSHTHADVAIVEDNTCFNIYNNVHPGDRLTSECHNSMLEKKNEFTSLFEYSVLTAGSLTVECDTSCSIAHTIAVGDTLQINEDGVLTVPSDSPADSGPFAQYGAWVGGNVDTGAGSLTITGGGFGVGGTVYGDTGSYPVIPLTQLQVIEGRLAISSQVCALSLSLQEGGKSTPGVVILSDGGSTITVGCNIRQVVCTVDIEASDLNAADDLTLNDSPIKINVRGREVVTMPTLSGGQGIWNFIDADVVRFLANNPTVEGAIVAPRASSIVVEGTLSGAVLAGNVESYTLVTNIGISDPVHCPYPLNRVILCDCLCAEKKEKEDA